MRLSTAISLISLAAQTVAAGKGASMYAYTCYDCHCDAFQSAEFYGQWDCINLYSGAAAIGIHRNSILYHTECTFFTEPDCGGESSAPYSISTFQTWTCPNSEIGWVQSVQCYQQF
jgi:hypothetical protein